MANKKVRHIKNIGSVYFDNTKQVWVGQVENGKYANGRTKYKRFLNSSQDEVIYKMKEFKRESTGLSYSSSTTKIDSPLVSDFFDSFIQTIKKPKLKPASYTRNLCTWNNNIKPYIGGYPITEVTTQTIQNEMINRMILNGLSYSTIHKAKTLANEGFRYAHRQGVISSNPCEFLELPKKSASTVKEIRFLNDCEINDFVKCSLDDSWKRTSFHNGYILVILIYTGLRAGEMIALKWQDVNLEDKFIRVKNNVAIVYDDDGRQVIEQVGTKTKKSRIVYLTTSALKFLSELYEIRKPNKSDYLFLTNGKRDLSSLTSLYEQTCKKANIYNPQGLHTLRHTFASLMIRKGVDIKIISEMLGHSSVSFTYNTYVHLIEEEKAKAITQIDV